MSRKNDWNISSIKVMPCWITGGGDFPAGPALVALHVTAVADESAVVDEPAVAGEPGVSPARDGTVAARISGDELRASAAVVDEPVAVDEPAVADEPVAADELEDGLAVLGELEVSPAQDGTAAARTSEGELQASAAVEDGPAVVDEPGVVVAETSVVLGVIVAADGLGAAPVVDEPLGPADSASDAFVGSGVLLADADVYRIELRCARLCPADSFQAELRLGGFR